MTFRACAPVFAFLPILAPFWPPFGARLFQARMATGIHGLPKVSPRPAMPDPSTPCGRATPKAALRLFLGGVPAGRAACGRLLPS
jgi:hypothetical protein